MRGRAGRREPAGRVPPSAHVPPPLPPVAPRPAHAALETLGPSRPVRQCAAHRRTAKRPLAAETESGPGCARGRGGGVLAVRRGGEIRARTEAERGGRSAGGGTTWRSRRRGDQHTLAAAVWVCVGGGEVTTRVGT